MIEKVIVTVKAQGDLYVKDMELPADIPAEELAIALAKLILKGAYSHSGAVRYYLKADPPGRFLMPEETLLSAGVWDGATVILTYS